MYRKYKRRKKRLVLLHLIAKIERNRRKKKRKLSKRQKAIRRAESFYDIYRKRAKKIVTFADALDEFMPKNLRYIISNSNFFDINKTASHHKYKKELIIRVPEVFSIIENPKQSFRIIKEIIDVFLTQSCGTLYFDYINCEYVDLLTEVLFDAILKDISRFIDDCSKAGIPYICKLRSLGAFHYKNIHKLINSVGSPAILLSRKSDYNDVVPFRLCCFDAQNASSAKILAQKEIDTTAVILYINKCLSKFHKELSSAALQQLGYVVGEILINAEEHSSTRYRYMIGYMEELNTGDIQQHAGVFNLVIMNFGKTIYEVFKYPTKDNPVNEECLKQMKQLSSKFTKKNWLGFGGISEETLWTLYSLQQGVTRIPNRKRGNGTIQFIESFFNLKDKDKLADDKISKMYLLSGRTLIEFDGTYRLQTKVDNDGSTRDIISFNKSGSIFEKPDTRYVRAVDNYFPGTALFVKLLLNDNDFKNE